MSGCNILVVVTGSIAAYKACEVVSDLVQRGHRVRAVATSSALRFIGAATLEGLTGRPALSDLFAEGAALEHVNLTRWADGVLICPATANTLNRLAAGLADDLAGALFLARDRDKPWLAAPAMNPEMWSHPATVASVERLRQWGLQILDVGRGRTACGESGEGRMAEPAAIIGEIEAAVARPARRLRVLVTSGGTTEPIDAVRALANVSTGRTGTGIADRLARAGHDVTLLRAVGSEGPAAPCREEFFGSFAELDSALTRILAAEAFDAIVHAAAVADFGVESVVLNGEAAPPGQAKLGSAAAPVLRLRLHPKIIRTLRERGRNPSLQIVAFKLTAGGDEPSVRGAVDSLFELGGADFVVHNDLKDRGGDGIFPADIYSSDRSPAVHCPTRGELAVELERLLVSHASLP